MSDLANSVIGRYVGSGRSRDDAAGFLAQIDLRLAGDGTCRLALDFGEDHRPGTPQPWHEAGTWRASPPDGIDVTAAGASLRYRFDPALPYQASLGKHTKWITLRGLVPAEYRGSIGLLARPDLFRGVGPGARFDAWARSTERVLAGTTLVDAGESMAATLALMASLPPPPDAKGKEFVLRRGSDEPSPLRIERGGRYELVVKRILTWLRGS